MKLTEAQRQTIAHAVGSCRLIEGMLMRVESELRTAQSRLQAVKTDLAGLLRDDAEAA